MSISPPKPATPLSSNAANAPLSFGDGDDRHVVQELYREHLGSLVRQLIRRTGCRELAYDLANETFLRLLRLAPGNVRQIQHPEAYLRRASSNLLQRWRKTEAFRARAITSRDLEVDPLVDQVAVLESRDTLRRLEHAMSKLKPKTREIFIAHRIHGFTYAEIAARTGLSIKGVEKQMSKAIAKIDQFLDRD